MKESPKDRIFLPLHCGNKGSPVRLRHIRDSSWSEHSLEASISCELLRRNTPVMPIICVVMILKEECHVLKLPKHL